MVHSIFQDNTAFSDLSHTDKYYNSENERLACGSVLTDDRRAAEQSAKPVFPHNMAFGAPCVFDYSYTSDS